MGTDAGEAEALAFEALRALHAGRRAEGASLYRRALESPDGGRVPVMRHVHLLEGSGRADAAAVVRRQALLAGADLSSNLLGRGGDPREAAREYEDLFARGVTNSRMVSEYMIALSRLGAADTLAAIAAPELLLRQEPLPVDLEDGAFLARVTRALLAARVGEVPESWRSLREMERVTRAHAIADPDVRALHRAVRQVFDQYTRAVAASRHLIAPWISQPYDLFSWSLIARETTGHSVPHRHEGCWAVAVAYVAGEPGGDEAGTLQIGADPRGDASCAGWPRAVVAPIPGTVVVMPAFYTHWTVPLAAPGLRISVAFNAALVDDYATIDAG